MLCANPPSRMRSSPLLPDSLPIYTGARLVQVDGVPRLSRPDTVREPTPPARLPMKAQSLRTDPPSLMVNVPLRESPTIRSPPTVQCGVCTAPGTISPVLETNWAWAGCVTLAA
ncbi:hypothetical protein D3C71_1818160 [compost metagenome]